MKFARGIVLFLTVAAAGAFAQAPGFDTSGNGLLKGTFYFRHVAYILADSAGDLGSALALYGNINFDGNGTYTVTGSNFLDSSVGVPRAVTTSGTYSIAASGYGFISSPLSKGDFVYGLVSGGIFIGSSTETTAIWNDLLIAAPLASPAPTNATFQGSYTMSGFFPAGTPANTADAFFQINPDGQGNLGTVNIQGYYGGGGTTQVTQTSANVKYFFSNGAAVVTFPNSTTAPFFSGQEYLYFSPDGNFVFGGAPDGFEMLVGVRNPAAGAVPRFAGLYYQGGIDVDLSSVSTAGYANLDTYYGSFSATPAGIVAADRLLSQFNASALSSTYADTYPATLGGSYKTAVAQYAFGNGGAVRIGAGIWPFLGINVAVQAPVFTAPADNPAPYLFPTGIANAASSSPFTAGVANGELITLYGANLASATTVANAVPFPTILGGVQVIVNGALAPIYYVSPGQISVILPSGNPYKIAAIQVVSKGVPSNIVTVPVNNTVPGVFTQTFNGLGYAAVVHNATGGLVTPASPAQAGEYIQVYVTGLGAVFPTVQDGAAGPSTEPLPRTTNTITAFIGGVPATVVYAGLAPTLAGLYQLNIQVPAGLTAGDHTLDIEGPDAYAAQALLPVGAATASATTSPAAESVTARPAGRRLPGASLNRSF